MRRQQEWKTHSGWASGEARGRRVYCEHTEACPDDLVLHGDNRALCLPGLPKRNKRLLPTKTGLQAQGHGSSR